MYTHDSSDNVLGFVYARSDAKARKKAAAFESKADVAIRRTPALRGAFQSARAEGERNVHDPLMSWTNPRNFSGGMPVGEKKANDGTEELEDFTEFMRPLSEDNVLVLQKMKDSIDWFIALRESYSKEKALENNAACPQEALCTAVMVARDISVQVGTIEDLLQKAVHGGAWAPVRLHDFVEEESKNLMDAVARIRAALESDTSMVREAFNVVYKK